MRNEEMSHKVGRMRHDLRFSAFIFLVRRQPDFGRWILLLIVNEGDVKFSKHIHEDCDHTLG